MGSRLENRVVLGSLRYKSASDTNLLFQIPLVQTTKENVEFDRTITVQLQQVYDNERQASTVFRPTCKLSLLFENKYTGSTSYYPFKSTLYYENITATANIACSNDPNIANVKYSGYPQFYEFDFMRPDNNISGYTTPDVNNKYHVYFVNKSATTYNWGLYMSYAYDNKYNQPMSAIDIKTQAVMNWVASDGIPFVVFRSTDQSQLVISFRCPMPHGLSVGEYVKLNFSYKNIDTFQVYSLGDSYYGNDEYIFNVYDVGFTGNTFNNGVNGTFKRIIDITNTGETTSEYYVRRNKILTEEDYAVLTKSGFEQQIFNKVKKREKSSISPNNQSRISLKESNTVYNLSFNEDIDIGSLKDNLTRPLTELFYTVIWKGYMGWTMGIGGFGLRKGWGFNIPPSTLTNNDPSPWWNNTNVDADTNFQLTKYTTPISLISNPARYFEYVTPFKKGDIIDGDYCEWNKSEQKERVISDLYHKFKFNPYFFKINGVAPGASFGDDSKGYYYKPLYPLTIRAYSDYLEEGDPKNVVGIPEYAKFSNKTNTFIWRDIYPYGYVDTLNIGVDYPFLNGKHYPYRDIVFRLFGEGSTYSNDINNSVVSEPTTDNCE